jgi:C1A family cysteine protease
VSDSNIFRNGLGALRPKTDLRDYKLSIAAQTFPTEYQLDPPQEIKDQGDVGSCVANMASYVKERLYQAVSGVYKRFSVGYIYGNKSDPTTSGMYLRNAFQILKNSGDVFNDDFDYDLEIPEIQAKLQESGSARLDALAAEHTVQTYFRVDGVTQIKTALQEYGYVGIGIPWYSDNAFDAIVTGKDVLQVVHQGTDYVGNHALTIYGWNEAGWLFANSWGAEWGNSGHCILPYEYPIEEAWCATTNPKEDIEKPIQNSLYDFILKIINIIINIFMKK